MRGIDPKQATAFAAITILSAVVTCQEPGGPAISDRRGGNGTVHALMDLTSTRTAPFPSNAFTLADDSQLTRMRVNQPMPASCIGRESDCEDIADLNTLDGFNVLPRITVPFDGDIDPLTANSNNIFLIPLGDARIGIGEDQPIPVGRNIGINQVMWDATSRVLAVTSNELLNQHSLYVLVVTRGVHAVNGTPVASLDFNELGRSSQLLDSAAAYHRQLLWGLRAAHRIGIPERRIAALSVFSTQSVTSTLEHIEEQMHTWIPAPATFQLGTGGERTVFPFNQVSSWTISRQNSVTPSFVSVTVSLASSNFIPNSVGQLIFGRFEAPEYRNKDLILPRVNTAESLVVQSMNTLYFNLWVPNSPRPLNGWPIVLCGHGSGRDKEACIDQVSVMNAHGLAVISINLAGHGFGGASTMMITRTGGSAVRLPAGGRGIDVDGDGAITAQEGDEAQRPHRLMLNRDGMIQDVVEFMALARLVETGGLDIDGDGVSDFDPNHITYTGQSLGSMYGTVLTAIEPHLRAATLSAPGGPPIENRIYSPIFRPGFGALLAQHVPSLINTPGISSLSGVAFAGPYFNENRPFRDQPPVTNLTYGAIEIQRYIDAVEWVAHNVDPAAWARHLRLRTIPGQPVKTFLYLAHRTDQASPGPDLSWIIRTCECQDRVSYYRHDLFWPAHKAAPKNPHGVILALSNPAFAVIAAGMLEQEAVFLASDGSITIRPSPTEYFEMPMATALPESLDYIP